MTLPGNIQVTPDAAQGVNLNFALKQKTCHMSKYGALFQIMTIMVNEK